MGNAQNMVATTCLRLRNHSGVRSPSRHSLRDPFRLLKRERSLGGGIVPQRLGIAWRNVFIIQRKLIKNIIRVIIVGGFRMNDDERAPSDGKANIVNNRLSLAKDVRCKHDTAKAASLSYSPVLQTSRSHC